MRRFAVALLFTLHGCSCGSERPPPPPRASASAPVPSAFADVRRPTRVYYVTNNADQCFLYWIDGDVRSEPRSLRCPRELLAGEKMRLTGRTCMRESKDPARRVPVRCNKTMQYAVADDRADAGEWKLRPLTKER